MANAEPARVWADHSDRKARWGGYLLACTAGVDMDEVCQGRSQTRESLNTISILYT
jgi:hypothetical protein